MSQMGRARPEEKVGRSKLTSTLALVGKVCPNCDTKLDILENPPVIVPDDLDALDWDYIKNRLLIPKVLAICLKCGFVAVECLTPAEARGTYLGT
ncbi:MAG TPA: hypothetical protein VED17_04755 [Nitrososphaerales archaeon]|nr:hypothetical protein [Nitrososphaerales archaeon]